MQSGSIQSPQKAADAGRHTQADAKRRRYLPLLKLGALLILGVVLVGTSVGRTNRRQAMIGQESGFLTFTSHVATTRHSYLHAVGGHLEDARGRPFSIRAINWSGLETSQQSLGGLETEDYGSILVRIKADGFNVIRLPFSNEMVENPLPFSTRPLADGKYQANQDLIGLSSLEILDRIVDKAASLDLRIILDNHRSEAGSSAEANGLWYTDRFTEAAWLDDWTTLARRYLNSPAVIGVDLRNEPHNALTGGACWGCEGPRDWRLAAERAGNLVLSINPKMLVIVEGTDSAQGQTTWWGGNLAGVRVAPVRLSRPSQLVYSAHVYGPTEYKQPWFSERTTAPQLWSLWDRQWGFISNADLAPVLVGEFGMPEQEMESEATKPGSEGQWFTSLLSYFSLHPNLGWAYWSLNAEDPYGWLARGYGAASYDSWRNRSLRLVISDKTYGSTPKKDDAEIKGCSFGRVIVRPAAVPLEGFQRKRPLAIKTGESTRSPTSDARSVRFRDPSVDAAIKTEIELATVRALATH